MHACITHALTRAGKTQGEDDKKWMLTLSELEREKILSERQDKRQIAKEAWMLQHQKKKQSQAHASAAAHHATTAKDRGEICGWDDIPFT